MKRIVLLALAGILTIGAMAGGKGKKAGTKQKCTSTCTQTCTPACKDKANCTKTSCDKKKA